jgi:hypothetical protein
VCAFKKRRKGKLNLSLFFFFFFKKKSSFHVTRPGKSGSKHNPVVHWRLSKQGVTGKKKERERNEMYIQVIKKSTTFLFV